MSQQTAADSPAAMPALPAPMPGQAALPPESPTHHPWLRAAILALLCAALTAWQPAYLLGHAALVPLGLVLGLLAAAAITRGPVTVLAGLLGVAAGDLAIGTPWLPTLAATLLLGAQAVLAAALMRRGDDAERLRLDTSERLRRLVLWAAPGAALLGALGGLLLPGWLLPEAGTLGQRAAAAHALGRWAVDWAGTVVVCAIAFCWLAAPLALWRPRRRLVALPLLGALLVLLPGLHQVALRDDQRQQVRFDQDAVTRVRQVQQQLAEPVAAVAAGRAVLAAGGPALPQRLFDSLAGTWTARSPGLRALGWLQASSDGSTRAWQLGHAYTPTGQEPALAAALGRAANSGEPGNLALPPAVQQALARALAADAPATAVLHGAQGGSVLVVLQAVAGDPPANRRVALAVTDLPRQLAPVLPDSQDQNLLVCLTDQPSSPAPGAEARAPAAAATAPGDPLLAGGAACAGAPTAGAFRTHAGRAALPDRTVSVLSVEPPTADNRLFTAVWLAGLPSVLGLGMLATLLLTITGRMHRIEDRVRERTAALQTEIDERRQAERALAHSEQRFRAIFEGVNIGVTVVDNDGRIQMANPAFCQMVDCPAEQLLGRPLADFRLPDVASDDGTAQALGGGAATRQRYLSTDGRVVQVAASLRELHDSTGQRVATVGALHDLTQVLRLREAEREREEAEVANRTKSEFLARLSHELRAPLNAIVGFTQMVDDSGHPADQAPQLRRHFAQIRQAGWHLLDMVSDVMDLSRLEAGTLRLNLEPVALPDLVQDTLTMLESTAQQAGVALNLSLSPQVEWVQADVVRLRQVLLNLVGNAVKYNRAGGQVEVRTRPAGVGELLIEVEDTGPGLTAEQVAELFKPFHRLGRERASVPGQLQDQGTGIGLVICRHLVDLMGGTLEVSSQLGEGSTFAVRLPRASGPAQARVAVQASSALGSQVSIGQVLYIEDNPADVEGMRALLAQRPGIRLQAATTAAAGLALADQADVLMLDLDLPDQSGLSVLQQVRADARLRHLPVIVVSAETRPERIDACFDAGATAFFSKPWEGAAVLRALDDALRAS